MKYDIQTLMKNDGSVCPECGKIHRGLLGECVIRDGAIDSLPDYIKKYGASHPFILCDTLTYKAAGEKVTGVLDKAGIGYTLHIVKRIHPSPDERIVGEAMLHCGNNCDMTIAVGGGVINDTCKILAAAKKCPDFIVGTAPSMDGFASGTSSMDRDGLKVSLTSKCPDVVFGEPSVLAAAPVHMICSGIGDMLAKYVSVAEWKIAHLLLGEYYCQRIADIVGEALAKCVENGPAAVSGDKAAAASIMEGLVVSGLAMNYAGISRPASGMEHYISHIIDMRALEFSSPADLHGIQCGIATLMTIRAYEKLASYTPDREKALAHAKAFDREKRFEYLREKLGTGAEAIIAGEMRENKYDPSKHAERLENIIAHWDEIKSIISSLPSSDELEAYMKKIGHPTSFEEIGLNHVQAAEAFDMAMEIRDKYVLGRLLWDLGIKDEIGGTI